MRKFLSGFCAALLLFCGANTMAFASQPIPLKTAWLGEHEAFAAWYAKQRGWDKKEGFTLEMIPFASGRDLLADSGGKQWVIGACGALPALTASLEKQLEIIAIGNDESAATGIYADKNSPILAESGYNPSFPDAAGSAGSIRGKTILCPVGSAAEYTVTRWLSIFGLTRNDVTIKNIAPEDSLAALAKGEGDVVALWSPYTHEAEQQGFKPVVMSNQCGASQPTLILTDKNFAQAHPEQVRAFLKMYFRGILALKTTPREQLLEQYRLFYNTWTGRNLPPLAAAWELAEHTVYTLPEQIALFDPAQGQLQKWLKDLAVFYGGENRLPALTDNYLKLLQ